MRISPTRLFICSLLVLSFSCEQKPTAPHAATQGEAEDILKRAAEFYAQHKGLSVQSRLEAFLVDDYGERLKDVPPYQDSRKFVTQLPNRFTFEGEKYIVTCDGTWLRLGRPGTDPYWRTSAPEKLSAVTESRIIPLFGGSDNARVLRMLDPGLVAALRESQEAIELVGQEPVNGRPAHHLRIRQVAAADEPPEAIKVTEVWIAAEGDPVVLQLRTLTPDLRAQASGAEHSAVLSTETFEDWEFDPDVEDQHFAMRPGKRRVGTLQQVLGKESELTGRPAADVELPLLGGGSVSLSELKNNKVVLLEFWATWCGPCRDELPHVIELAREFEPQGVVLYAVNAQEDPQQIQSFLRSEGLQMQVALDATGEISDAFGVNAIPHVALLGRDGTIQSVHIGVGADTKEALREEIEAAAAGRNLVAEGLPDP